MPSNKKYPKDRDAIIHASRSFHQNRHFSFDVEDVTLPNGVRREMAMVRHPGSTAIVAVTDDDQIAMIRQYRHVVRKSLWEIPAGTMEPGEPPLNCAKRELEEETGFMAGHWVDLGKIHILPSYTDELIYLYLARECTLSRSNPDQDEIIEVFTYPFQTLITMIEAGEITDALTILALYRVEALLKSG